MDLVKGLGKDNFNNIMNKAGGNIEVIAKATILALYKSGKKEQADKFKKEIFDMKKQSIENAFKSKTKEDIEAALSLEELNLEEQKLKVETIKKLLGDNK